MKNQWHGWYAQYGPRTDMIFETLKIKKSKIRGHGSDVNGEFEIKGKVDHDKVEFTKQYIGKHAVEYSGTLEGHTIRGKWSISSFGLEDEFELKKQHTSGDSCDSAESD